MEHLVTVEGKEGDGLKIGDRRFDVVVMKRLNAQAVVEAQEAAEVLRFIQAGGESVPILVQSPARVTVERIRRMVVRIESSAGGDSHPGEMNKAFLAQLSDADYDRMIEAANMLDDAAAATIKKADRSGRDGGAGSDD